ILLETFLLSLCVCLPPPQGAHSLHYNLTVRSQGGSVQSRSFAEGYWDHQLFLRYDSDNQESAEPRGPWAEKLLGTENWNTEMHELAEHSKKLKVTVTHSWMVHPSSAQTLAMKVKNSWDADGMQSKDYWVLLQEELCGRLQRYLFSWKVPPAVNVSCGEALENTVSMILGFQLLIPKYLSNMTSAWGTLNIDTQQPQDVLIPKRQKQSFSGHVEHRRNDSTSPVLFSGIGLLLQSRRPACLCVAAGGVAVIMIIVCVLWCKKRKTTSATEDLGEKNGRWLEMAGPVCDHRQLCQFSVQHFHSLLGMEVWSPEQPQEAGALGEEMGSQGSVDQ
uniref:MHC class I-like antigen recognition-like domain-containing protein n=1 Tax=Sciurus vulgaris TaxID=55149 RepID=A0A8D2ASH3_SCIVU